MLVLVVIPLALLRNGFRIFVIAQLCVRIGPQMIDSPIHRHGGPVFFVLSLVPLFLLLVYLSKRELRKEQAIGRSTKEIIMRKSTQVLITFAAVALCGAFIDRLFRKSENGPAPGARRQVLCRRRLLKGGGGIPHRAPPGQRQCAHHQPVGRHLLSSKAVSAAPIAYVAKAGELLPERYRACM